MYLSLCVDAEVCPCQCVSIMVRVGGVVVVKWSAVGLRVVVVAAVVVVAVLLVKKT